MQIIGISRYVVFAFLIFCCGTLNTAGDELPASKLARGTSEHLLADIDIFKTSIKQAEKMLGKPTSVQETSPESHNIAEHIDIAGENTYVWEKPGITIELITEFFHDQKLKGGFVESTRVVTVTGTDGVIGRTGRGLKLGNPYSEVARIYGNRFDRRHDGVGDLIMIEWKTGSSLVVRWNEKGVINEIELYTPE